MQQHFDIVVVGSGPSAQRIALACADQFQVAIIDGRAIGGTCAIRGCNPKKVLARAAELLDWAERSNGQLISVSDARIDWPQLIEFKRTFTDPIEEKTQRKLAGQDVTIFQSSARFTGPNSLQVGDDELTGDKIVICTGAKPVPLNIAGEEHVTLSDVFMETETLPASLLFIGGGYISFEFAHVARRAGAEVCIIDRNPQLFAGFDPEIVDKLVEYTRSIGIDVHLQTEAQQIDKHKDGQLCLTANRNGEETKFNAGMIVHGAGRVPAVDELDLDAAGIEFDKGGVVVNQYMQSRSNPNVYVAGDVASTAQAKLTPVANEQGRAVAKNLREGNSMTPDYGVVPTVVYTVPALAAIGMTEAAARDAGYDVDVRAGDMSHWTSIRKVGAPCAAYKILVDKQTDQFLGAHLVAPHAADTINIFALAMKFKLTATNMKSVLFAFPSFSSDIRSMI